VLDGIANDLRPWFTKFGGTLYDRRWLPVVEDIYVWHYKNERYLRNEEPLARVGMVYSQQTAHFYGGEKARAKVEDHTLGYYQALIESRIPFEMVHDGLLDAAHVDKFKVLIFPNIAALSTAQCDQIRAYVQRGGSIVATYETSLYDEWGVRRADFGLAELFGASYGGSVEARMQNSYLRLGNPRHPILAGLEDTERIINGVSRVQTKGSDPNAPLTLIPSYPDLPMEEVFPRVSKTDTPEVYVRETGKGRVVYFPWDIDRTFWEVLSVDHLKLLRNAVDWAANEPRPVEVTGPGTLDVTLWRQKDSLTVHLVNLTNPMMMKGPLREFIPTPPQQVTVRLPSKARKVQLLVSRHAPRVHETNDSVTLTIPSIVDHEVIAIDL
jgi:type 1 glutamine amidotransferase